MFVPAAALSAVLLKPMYAPMGRLQDTPPAAVPSPPPIVPVPLPNPALSDADYKAALAPLLADGAQRPGVCVSLLRYLPPPGSDDPLPQHVGVIVELMDHWLTSPNKLETLLPLRVVARCGSIAQPEWTKVLPLADSILIRVRVAAVEALGGIYVVKSGTPADAPPIVRNTLLKMAETDSSPVVQMMAAMAIGHARIATPAAVNALAALAGSANDGIALGALNAAGRLGPDARRMLPAIEKCLADPRRVNNAAPTLIAVATPRETARIFAETIAATRDLAVLNTLVYYSGHLTAKSGSPDVEPLAVAIKPLLAGLPAPAPVPEATPTPIIIDPTMPSPSPTPEPEPTPAPTPSDLAALRIASARAYVALTGDLKTASAPLIELASDQNSTPAIRARAVTAIQTLGATVNRDPTVVHALVGALGDPDTSVQDAAIGVLFKFGGPASAAAAPRLSALLLEAWQNKENGRVYTLINALYRIGPIAAHAATPVLKTIHAGEPAGSANARFAEITLQRMSQ